MVFSSNLFIFFFLPITIWGYYFLGKKLQNVFLLFVSLLFFAWSQPQFVWVILLNILVNYCGALAIGNVKNKIVKKLSLIIDISVNLGLLFYFKYFNFVIDSINHVIDSNIIVDQIVLPIGISFFTFQGLSYVFDVYLGKVEVQKNPFKVALYILFFPQLIAGPIVKYGDIALEIDNRAVSLDDFTEGLERFIIGLGKKAIISNTMAVMVDKIWERGIDQNTVAIAWIGCIGYTLQIYYDFSGYSDMAIGLGRIFGFHFNENFNLPYISKSVTEFWKRWHISLTTWFREYVYIPLGGNRKHVYLNVAIVFLLTGIWHGASWTFILWGIWHGVFRLIEMYFNKTNKKIKLAKIPLLGNIYTLSVVGKGWILFRAPNLSDAIYYLKTMVGIDLGSMPGFTVGYYLDRWNVTNMALGILFATAIPGKIVLHIKSVCSEKVYFIGKKVLLLFLFYFSLIRIVAGTYNPFIYFQF